MKEEKVPEKSVIGYFILLFLLIAAFTCAYFIWKTQTQIKPPLSVEILVDAPVDWLWKHYPLSFDMKYIFGVDRDRMPIKGGIFSQTPDANFPAIGSSIVYQTAKKEIVEKVLVRNETTKTFETVTTMPYAYVTSCMVFKGKTP